MQIPGSTFDPAKPVYPCFDAGPAQNVSMGVGGETVVSANMATTNAANVTDAPSTGNKLVITDVEIAADTTMFVTLTDSAGGNVVGKVWVAGNSTVALTPRGKRKLPNANSKLKATASVAGNIAVTAFYYSES